jgi:REP element-mobilizing transposase RayT
MARPPRLLVPNGIYHVYARGNRRQAIWRDDGDRRYFLAILAKLVRQLEWVCHAYCLMPNHFHLLLETRLPNLSAGMQRLNGAYAHSFNWRHGLDGHVFQGRFGSRLVDGNHHLVELSRYIVRNPIRARLCEDAHEWPWSSFGAAAGLAPRPAFLTLDLVLAQFGSEPAAAARNYAAFVAAPRPGETA